MNIGQEQEKEEEEEEKLATPGPHKGATSRNHVTFVMQ